MLWKYVFNTIFIPVYHCLLCRDDCVWCIPVQLIIDGFIDIVFLVYLLFLRRWTALKFIIDYSKGLAINQSWSFAASKFDQFIGFQFQFPLRNFLFYLGSINSALPEYNMTQRIGKLIGNTAYNIISPRDHPRPILSKFQ